MRTAIAFYFFLGACAYGCVPVTGDNILMRDLTTALPAFQTVDPQQVVGFAPFPGTVRNFKAVEIEQLLKRFHVDPTTLTVQDVCFESTAAILTEEQIRTAVAAAVGLPVVAFRLLDFGRSPVPPGRLEFPLSAVVHSTMHSAVGPVCWRGRLVTESGRSFPVWAKLILVVKAPAVVLVRDLNRDHILTSDDLKLVEEAPFPLPDGTIVAVEDALGKSLRFHVSAGEALAASLLDLPKTVILGETVRVEAISGKATISFDALAQTSGRIGDLILIKNPNGRNFRARVMEKGRVEVRSAGSGSED